MRWYKNFNHFITWRKYITRHLLHSKNHPNSCAFYRLEKELGKENNGMRFEKKMH